MLETLVRAQAAVARVTALDKQLGARLTERFTLLADPVQHHFDRGGSRDRDKDAEYLADGEKIVAETLAFLAGASARTLELDDGLAALAQAWLDLLSDKTGLKQVAVVIPAPTESSADMLTQVVRLKLPAHGVWGLPVAIHEYGHFVASELKRRDDDGGVPHQVAPVEALLHGAGAGDDEEDGVPARYWHGHELFADAVASVVTGPAYLRYCLRYRFDPRLADTGQSTHPSPAVRVRTQLAVLKDLAAEDGGEYLRDDIRKLAKAWEASVAATAPPAPDNDPLLSLSGEIVKFVRTNNEVQSIRYHDHLRARALAERVELEADPTEFTVAQVLNAAWVRRDSVEREPEEPAGRVGDLGERAKQLITEILARG